MIKWHHSIPIGDEETPGLYTDCKNVFKILPIPENLKNKSVLDIGCWDGYYSFMCEQRGAQRVVANDWHVWHEQSWLNPSGSAGFDFAHKNLKSKVEKLECPVEHLVNLKDKFDYVLMLLVICLADNPVQYMKIAKNLSKNKIIFSAHIDLIEIQEPMAKYYSRNQTNTLDKWGFNPPAICAIMEDIGIKDIQINKYSKNECLFWGTVT
jgi:tRNA (mo5U34)-methyltransferase